MTTSTTSIATALASGTTMISTVRPCPVCHSRSASGIHRQRYALFDDSALPDETEVVACLDCGTVFATSNATAADYRRHYASHSKYETAVNASGSGETASDAARLDELVAFVTTRMRGGASGAPNVLDIGAGRGGLLAAFRHRGFERLAGIDPSPGCVAAMKAAGFEAHVGELEHEDWPIDPVCFDLVVLSHVLEHVFDVATVFDRIAQRVTAQGSIYIEVPDASRYTTEGFPPFYFFDPEHINHFDAGAIDRLAASRGWIVDSTWSRELDLGTGQRYPAVGVLMSRNDDAVAQRAHAGIDAVVALARYVERSNEAFGDVVDEETSHALAESVRPVIVWGAGSHAQRLLAQSSLARCAIDCIIDADTGKQGRRLAGHLVVAPELGLERARAIDAVIVIAVAVGHPSIAERLHDVLPAARVLRL